MKPHHKKHKVTQPEHRNSHACTLPFIQHNDSLLLPLRWHRLFTQYPLKAQSVHFFGLRSRVNEDLQENRWFHIRFSFIPHSPSWLQSLKTCLKMRSNTKRSLSVAGVWHVRWTLHVFWCKNKKNAAVDIVSTSHSIINIYIFFFSVKF